MDCKFVRSMLFSKPSENLQVWKWSSLAKINIIIIVWIQIGERIGLEKNTWKFPQPPPANWMLRQRSQSVWTSARCRWIRHGGRSSRTSISWWHPRTTTARSGSSDSRRIHKMSPIGNPFRSRTSQPAWPSKRHSHARILGPSRTSTPFQISPSSSRSEKRIAKERLCARILHLRQVPNTGMTHIHCEFD